MDTRYHIKDIKIVLTDGKYKYQSGDDINGNVVIAVKGDLNGSELSIKLIAIADIKWTELPRFKSEGSTADSRQIYLEHSYDLPESNKKILCYFESIMHDKYCCPSGYFSTKIHILCIFV